MSETSKAWAAQYAQTYFGNVAAVKAAQAQAVNGSSRLRKALLGIAGLGAAGGAATLALSPEARNYVGNLLGINPADVTPADVEEVSGGRSGLAAAGNVGLGTAAGAGLGFGAERGLVRYGPQLRKSDLGLGRAGGRVMEKVYDRIVPGEPAPQRLVDLSQGLEAAGKRVNKGINAAVTKLTPDYGKVRKTDLGLGHAGGKVLEKMYGKLVPGEPAPRRMLALSEGLESAGKRVNKGINAVSRTKGARGAIGGGGIGLLAALAGNALTSGGGDSGGVGNIKTASQKMAQAGLQWTPPRGSALDRYLARKQAAAQA